MNRAERRRMDKQAKKKSLPLQLVPEIAGPIEVTPARLAMIRKDIADDLMRRSGDQAAIEEAWRDGYNKGRDEGVDYAQQHFLTLLYISCGLALESIYGFKAKRISKVWHKFDDIYGEMLHLLDDGLPMDDIEDMFNARLKRLSGMEFVLTHSSDELRQNEGYNGGTGEADAS